MFGAPCLGKRFEYISTHRLTAVLNSVNFDHHQFASSSDSPLSAGRRGQSVYESAYRPPMYKG